MALVDDDVGYNVDDEGDKSGRSVKEWGPVAHTKVPSDYFMLVIVSADDDDDVDNSRESKRGTCHRYEGLQWPLYPPPLTANTPARPPQILRIIILIMILSSSATPVYPELVWQVKVGMNKTFNKLNLIREAVKPLDIVQNTEKLM